MRAHVYIMHSHRPVRPGRGDVAYITHTLTHARARARTHTHTCARTENLYKPRAPSRMHVSPEFNVPRRAHTAVALLSLPEQLLYHHHHHHPFSFECVCVLLLCRRGVCSSNISGKEVFFLLAVNRVAPPPPPLARATGLLTLTDYLVLIHTQTQTQTQHPTFGAAAAVASAASAAASLGIIKTRHTHTRQQHVGKHC